MIHKHERLSLGCGEGDSLAILDHHLRRLWRLYLILWGLGKSNIKYKQPCISSGLLIDVQLLWGRAIEPKNTPHAPSYQQSTIDNRQSKNGPHSRLRIKVQADNLFFNPITAGFSGSDDCDDN